jgi:cytochrome c
MSRARFALAILLISAAALSACSKADQTAATPPAAVPVELTDVQKAALVAELPAPYNTGDIANGKSVFLICKSCHTLVEGGASMTGPNLWGVFGRKAATVAGFNYSDPMKAAALTWDAATMDKWITDPKALVPGTKMSFVGIKSPKDRIDVIAYLKSETSAAK